MEEKKNGKKRVEASKIYVNAVLLVFWLVAIFTMIMIAITKDMSALEKLIESVSAAATVGLAFYFGKAKVENRIKLMKKYKVDPDADSFREE